MSVTATRGAGISSSIGFLEKKDKAVEESFLNTPQTRGNHGCEVIISGNSK
jgi:hypothetical protein